MRPSISKLKDKIMPGIVAASVALATPASAFAVTVKKNLDAESVVGKILDVLITAAQLVGAGILIYAFISFAMAIAQENPDQRSRAIMFIVAGAILVGISTFMKKAGIIA